MAASAIVNSRSDFLEVNMGTLPLAYIAIEPMLQWTSCEPRDSVGESPFLAGFDQTREDALNNRRSGEPSTGDRGSKPLTTGLEGPASDRLC